MVNLGINSESVAFEVALEIIGQKRRPVMVMMYEEKAKANPSKAYIDFCKNLINAIDEFQESLKPADLDVIDMVVSGKGLPI